MNKLSNKVSIILTTTVNVDANSAFQVNPTERINLYIKSLHLWLGRTDFNIILVENSGYPFKELEEEMEKYKNRLEIITFNQQDEIVNKEPQMHLKCKGGLEIESIHYAYNNSEILKKTTFIIKITGRFFVPYFEKFINSINIENYDGLKQNFDFRCEIVGSHIKNFDTIFDRNLFIENGKYDYHVENVYMYRFSLFKNILTCPIFNIEPTQRGGLNEIYYKL
jgi:hypothetical protein